MLYCSGSGQELLLYLPTQIRFPIGENWLNIEEKDWKILNVSLTSPGGTLKVFPFGSVIKFLLSVLCHGMREFRELSDTIYRDVIENSSLVKPDVNTRDSEENF